MSTVHVSEETHEKIEDIQDESGYTPTKKEVVKKAVEKLHNEEVQSDNQQANEAN